MKKLLIGLLATLSFSSFATQSFNCVTPSLDSEVEYITIENGLAELSRKGERKFPVIETPSGEFHIKYRDSKNRVWKISLTPTFHERVFLKADLGSYGVKHPTICVLRD